MLSQEVHRMNHSMAVEDVVILHLGHMKTSESSQDLASLATGKELLRCLKTREALILPPVRRGLPVSLAFFGVWRV